MTLFFCVSYALKLPLPSTGNDISGKLSSTTLRENKDLASIARKHDLGYFELIQANPQLNPKHLQSGTLLVLPTKFLIPSVQREGIVINLSTMRLYYFPPGKNYFYTYPVGIGKQKWNSPLGTFKITQKEENPVWIVPKSIYEFRKKKGIPIAKVVQAGPDNPLGKYAMRLSLPTFLIHGTNDPASVGVRSSAGCIHLYPEDIKQLFSMVTVGTHVHIINQPYVFGWRGKKLYLDAHLPLAEQRQALKQTAEEINSFSREYETHGVMINQAQTRSAVKDHLGIPLEVGEMASRP